MYHGIVYQYQHFYTFVLIFNSEVQIFFTISKSNSWNNVSEIMDNLGYIVLVTNESNEDITELLV